MEVPEIAVGILSVPVVRFGMNSPYRLVETGEVVCGEYQVSTGDVLPLTFEPLDPEETCFELYDVTIGVDFHWERKENQRFRGKLKLIAVDNAVIAINVLPIEDYLISVISSEMSATSSLEFLKAHAVISRSWLMAQKEKASGLKHTPTTYSSCKETEDEYIRWYDREDHEHFDVCADDHCQRYQGITKVSTEIVKEAVESTYGEFLTYKGNICDARFSKCCGGLTEKFENNWEPVPHSYLTSLADNPENPVGYDLNLKEEKAVKKWLLDSPPAFCNTQDKSVLTQVLNNYDRETSDFYRWRTEISQAQISEWVRRKTGRNLGAITDLTPVERGNSGRLIRLKLVGNEGSLTIGKELFIRKILSESHLYSSAFVVEKGELVNGIPSMFILHGAGWGHGTGLCQIGAAVMGEKGYTYNEILAHYFPGTLLEKKYEKS